MTSTEAKAGSETTLTVGDLFGRTFALWGARFVPNAILALIFHAPLILIAWAVLGRGTPTAKTVESWNSAQAFLTSLLGMLSSAAITYGSFRALRGEPATIGACAGRAFSSFGSLFVAGLIVGLLTMVVAIPIVAVAAAILAGTRGGLDTGATVFVGVFVGIAGAFILTRYALSSPAIVVERVGASKSLKESVRLTAGFRWTIFCLFVLVFAALFGAGYVVGFTIHDPFTSVLATLGLTILLESPISACAAAVAYHRLKLRKDGINVLDAAKVFD